VTGHPNTVRDGFSPDKGAQMAHIPLARLGGCLGSAILATLTLAGPASAQPITGTDHSRFSESFSDEAFQCQDELYTTSVNGRSFSHFTYFQETGALHFHEVVYGKVVAVPLDGTGTTYRGNFRTSDSESIRAVRHGNVLVETDTDLDRVVARGSDGSRVFAKFHAHFTVNANGQTTVQLETDRMTCT
jgi:hypothetical protein